ncbi:hypothetical protein EMIHUDRAFT_234451 [Emiliania huxleyi CCMP1516]|uniref:Uncharacterized protein n=2 Tax=Emiliania huxleyi TaxID=2903 RepID=A0A0D3JZI5_EMIH1|nr:hypothetical protein EMIHUDRAFT_234451 [Emiliania huxleyi CCMP1516]EOD28920.1 hypothetical protein EMIHUDRAFT_234451 [Emiliania huxleyi CCMP1516]|eukprot:XP_005781349.1 hypothetical protein EMIHUDRAFT_234451 [Emiliania huxleyi CCMP1516]
MPSLSTFGLTTLLLGGAFSKECVIKDVGRRLPWAPGWSFKLKDCTVLSLSDAGLGDSGVKGCVALADALSSPGSGLATLYLENNAIGDRGAIALGAALERNTALETLGLLGNELTGAGRAALQKAGFAGSGLSLPGAEDEYQRLGSNGPALRGFAGAVSARALLSAALVLVAAALPLLVAARVAARRRDGVARLESLH